MELRPAIQHEDEAHGEQRAEDKLDKPRVGGRYTGHVAADGEAEEAADPHLQPAHDGCACTVLAIGSAALAAPLAARM